MGHGLWMFRILSYCGPSSKISFIQHVLSDSFRFEFMVKMTYYTLLSRNYGLAFVNQRSYDHRPIYGTRWVGWSFAVPTMVFMNLYPLMDDHRAIDVLIRLFPQMAASSTYCWASGLGCILNDPWMGWFLCILGCVAYVAIVADEIAYVRERLSLTSQPVTKGWTAGVSVGVRPCACEHEIRTVRASK